MLRIVQRKTTQQIPALLSSAQILLIWSLRRPTPALAYVPVATGARRSS